MATATATEYSTMIAVFASYDQANQAIDNLRHAGYGYDHIRLVERGPNNFIENLKSLFSSQVTAMATSANDWMRIGVPEQEAHHYQDELDAGRPIVLVKSVDDPERAFGILRQCGAYDLSTRLRMSPPTSAAGTRQPGATQATQGMQDTSRQQGAYTPSGEPTTPGRQPTTSDEQPTTYDEQSTTYDEQPRYNAAQEQPRQTAPSDDQRRSL
jgi:cell division septation protein DedD